MKLNSRFQSKQATRSNSFLYCDDLPTAQPVALDEQAVAFVAAPEQNSDHELVVSLLAQLKQQQVQEDGLLGASSNIPSPKARNRIEVIPMLLEDDRLAQIQREKAELNKKQLQLMKMEQEVLQERQVKAQPHLEDLFVLPRMPLMLQPLPPPQSSHTSMSTGSAKKGQNVERWNDAEHELFLDGVERYGRRKQTMIASMVRGRTVKQVISHSQKFFAKLQRAFEQSRLLAEEQVSQIAQRYLKPALARYGNGEAAGPDARARVQDLAGKVQNVVDICPRPKLIVDWLAELMQNDQLLCNAVAQLPTQ